MKKSPKSRKHWRHREEKRGLRDDKSLKFVGNFSTLNAQVPKDGHDAWKQVVMAWYLVNITLKAAEIELVISVIGSKKV